MAGSFILVGRAQGRSERGVFDRPFTLPVLIILAFPLSGLNATAKSELEGCLPSLLKGCNYCHTGVLDSLVHMHDSTFIHKHTHTHTHAYTTSSGFSTKYHCTSQSL